VLPAAKLFVWALVKLTATLSVPPLKVVTCPVILPILAVTVLAGTDGGDDPVGPTANSQLTGEFRVIVGFERNVVGSPRIEVATD